MQHSVVVVWLLGPLSIYCGFKLYHFPIAVSYKVTSFAYFAPTTYFNHYKVTRETNQIFQRSFVSDRDRKNKNKTKQNKTKQNKNENKNEVDEFTHLRKNMSVCVWFE